MRTAFLILLCAVLTASLIWGCSLYSKAEGLESSLAAMQRRYEALQILYTQARQEADDLTAAREREAAARLAAARPTAAPAEGLAAVLRFLTSPEGSPSPSPLPSPAPEILELSPLFPLPEVSPMPSPSPAAPEDGDTQE